MFFQTCFNILTFLIAYHINLLSLNHLSKLSSFPKLVKNNITFVISNIFLFRANYIIGKTAI